MTVAVGLTALLAVLAIGFSIISIGGKDASSSTTATMAGGSFKVKLTPGRYELVCLMPGHYGGGQHEAFTVTG